MNESGENLITPKVFHDIEQTARRNALENPLPVAEVEAQVSQKLDTVNKEMAGNKPGTIFLFGDDRSGSGKPDDDSIFLIPRERPVVGGVFDERNVQLYPPVVDKSPVSAEAFQEICARLGINLGDYPDKHFPEYPMGYVSWNKVVGTRLKNVFYHESALEMPGQSCQAASFLTVNVDYRSKVTRKAQEAYPFYFLRKHVGNK